MANWLYAPISELAEMTISTPNDLSSSPVMRYLALILDEAMLQDGAFKATAKGNLPTKLVKQASALLPEFAVAKFETPICINNYAGSTRINLMRCITLGYWPRLPASFTLKVGVFM
jgi:hypothetical protein